jgi:hypothetical protein
MIQDMSGENSITAVFTRSIKRWKGGGERVNFIGPCRKCAFLSVRFFVKIQNPILIP